MQVFKTFMRITLKRLPTALIYVGIFMIFSVIMAKNSSEDMKFTNFKLDVCVIDEDNSEASEAFSNFIEENHNIVEIENNKDSILNAIYYGTVDYVITIKEGYQDKILNGETENLFTNYTKPGNSGAVFLENSISEYAGALSAFITAENELPSALDKTSGILAKEIDVDIETFEAKSNSTYTTTFAYYFQFLSYTFIAILISLIAPIFLTMNSTEMQNRTNCSSLKSSSQSLQMALGTGLVVLAVWILFMIVALIFNNGVIDEKVGLAMLNSFVFIIVTAGLSLFLSVIIPSKRAIDMIATTLSLGMSFLCGVFVPLSVLGDGVASVSRFLPAYWYVRANNLLAGVSDEIYSSEKYFSFLGIEMLFAIAFFVLFFLISRIRKNAK